jgi:P-type Cu2+ transporter
VRARVDGREVLVGQPALLRDLGATLPPELQAATAQAEASGQSVVHLLAGGQPVAAIARGDVIREESHEAVRRLKCQGIRVAMLTGDSDAVARAVARELGIDEYFARVLPEEKSRRVQELRDRGRRATGYNIVAIPLAAGVLAAQGILLVPAVAAILMSASTVVVAVNAQLLRRAERRIAGPSGA